MWINQIKAFYCFSLFFLLLFAFSSLSFAESLDHKWWQQNYEVEQSSETIYTYGADGTRTASTTTEDAPIRFYEPKPFTKNDFSDAQKKIYLMIQQNYPTEAEPDYDAFIEKISNRFSWDLYDEIVNMIGFYEFEKHKGYYEYLSKKPTDEEIAILDDWHNAHLNQYPDAPATYDTYLDITNKIIQQLSENYQKPIEEIEETIHKMEKLQEAYELNISKPLKETITIAFPPSSDNSETKE